MMEITGIELIEFEEYARDHLEHFDAIPVEFESSLEVVYTPTECWDAATTLGLTKLIVN